MPRDDTNALRDRLQTLFGSELVIERELGRGGMAAVFAAYDPGLQRRVAVKMLLPEIADEEVSERFLREGRTVASLHHPHVVAVYAVRSGHGTNAIVMQYVEGRSLDVVLSQQPVIPLNAAARILSQVASGLQHAHDRGVIHRDVKPANVLIDQVGRAVVSDFGIARRDDGLTVTKTGVVLGTSDYMSPEQRAGERVAPATDQYAFGVMAFEVLTGRLPFIGTLEESIRGHMSEAPPSLQELRAEIPPVVEDLVHRMLAKDPSQRWPSLAEAEDVFGSLSTLGGDTPRLVRAVTPSVPAPVSVAAPASRSRTMAIVIAAVVIVALAVWAAVVWRGGRAPGSPISGAMTGAGDSSAATVVPPGRDQGAPPPAPGAARGAEDRAASNARTSARGAAPAPSNVGPGTDAAPGAAAEPPQPAPSVAGPPVAASTSLKNDAPPATDSAAPASASTATLADARQVGRAFVTMLNQRRARELAQLTPIGGDAVARAELIKLTESAPDFAAGFERLPAAPVASANGFETELFVDLEWRGGKRILRVTLRALRSADGWRMAGLGVEPAG